jgi:hypothetical protein
MTCQICKKKPSTGIIFAMCDECFDEFEKRIPEEGGYVPTEAEVEAINEPFIDRSRS